MSDSVRHGPPREPLRCTEHHNFLTEEECLYFINLGKDAGLKPALLVGSKTGHDVKDEARTNTSTWVKHNTSEQTIKVVERIAKLVNLPVINAEQIQIIHYDPQEFYKPHYDGWKMPQNPEERSEEERIIKARYMDGQGGQRLVTCLVYLNSVEKGGATHFPSLNKSMQPEAGKLLIFWNVYEGTDRLHPDSLHAGQPVEVGEKWAFNLWFRAGDARREFR